MIFKCGLCETTKMAKFHQLEYSALNEKNEKTKYKMNICVECSIVFQRSGLNGAIYPIEEDED